MHAAPPLPRATGVYLLYYVGHNCIRDEDECPTHASIGLMWAKKLNGPWHRCACVRACSAVGPGLQPDQHPQSTGAPDALCGSTHSTHYCPDYCPLCMLSQTEGKIGQWLTG